MATHGMSNTRIYTIWAQMRDRCNNKNRECYQHYGERGISVCEKWDTFEGFYQDMGDSYEEGLTIDRVDNSKGYSKDNCRWSTMKDQSRNRRSNRKVLYNGTEQCIADVIDQLGLNSSTVYTRLWRGWDVYRALGLENILLDKKEGCI